jgi:hypothetical protein
VHYIVSVPKRRLNNALSSCSYVHISLLIVMAICVAARAQSGEESRTARSATDLVGITRNWSLGKASTPGTNIRVREVKRIEDHGNLMVQYHYYLAGAAGDQIYSSFNWPVNVAGPVETMQGLTVGPDGLVICAGRTTEQCGSPDKKDDPVEFTFLPAKGEIYREALVSADGNTKVFFAVIPDPIIGRDKDCTLEAIRIQPKFETAMIWGKGFKPNEALQFIGKSYDEAHDVPEKADENGEFVMALFPFVKGKQSGKTDLKLRSAACSPSVSFEWGK